MDSYLVQRAKFGKYKNRVGIDSLLRFDYMGSAEFEFGAMLKSLKRIREDIDHYDFSTINIEGKKVGIFADIRQVFDIERIIREHAKNGLRTKEGVRFSDWILGKELEYLPDFWWDIENDFMWWKHKKDTSKKLVNAIKQIK